VAPYRRSTPTRHTASDAPPRAGDVLLALDDPFSADLALRPAFASGRIREFVGLSTAGGVPARPRTALAAPLKGPHISLGWFLPPISREFAPGSPRGPPSSQLTISSPLVS